MNPVVELLRIAARALRLPVAPPAPRRAPGVRDGRLAPCGRAPNCVSSQSEHASHAVAPLPGAGGREATISRVRTLLRSLPGARVVDEAPGYLHAEITTRGLRFVDDLELVWDDADGVLHVRSASRVGRRDFGANRRRIEWIRARLRPLSA